MTNLKPYILDNAATAEHQRLDLMSKILDPWTRGYLRDLGLGPGWHCLELGSGNGSVAEWLCAGVGPAGSVTAGDVNPALLDDQDYWTQCWMMTAIWARKPGAG